MSFTVKSKIAAMQEAIEFIQGTASTAYVKDSLVKMVNGLPVALAGQTDTPFGIMQEMEIQPYNGQSLGNVNGLVASPLRPATTDQMTSTTAGEKFMIVPVTSLQEADTDMVPLLNQVAAITNTNVAQAICVYGGSTGDFTGGCVYLPEQDWQGVITSSAVGGGNVTLVFAPPAPRACTLNDKVCAIPFGVGAAPKFDSANPHLTISNAVADKSGGNVIVRKVQGQFGSTRGSLFRITVAFKNPI